MPTTSTDHVHDVVIVGARCAGAATAMLLAEHGHDVVVVDRALLPSDTLSTHSIARGGVVQLQRWGLLAAVLASGAPALRTVLFHANGTSIARTIKDRAGVDHLVAPRRHVLDAVLADAAVAAGASLRTGIRVAGITRAHDARVTGVVGRGPDGPLELRARLVVGADGLRSRVARAVAAPVTLERPPGGATTYAYYAGVEWPAIEYFLRPQSFSGVFPTNAGEACIWTCLPADVTRRLRAAGPPETAFERILAVAAPELATRLTSARRTSPPRTASGLPNRFHQAAGPGWALVGDAGYHRDAITGHGITDAFRDADLLADAVTAALAGDADALGRYEAARDAIARPIFDLTCELGALPAPARFVELQRALSHAIDTEATTLAARGTDVARAA